MDPISLEELALLDVLQRIDQGQPLTRHSQVLRDRLVTTALVEPGLIVPGEENNLRLTDAGVERCKSLRHRVAADAEALLVIRDREDAQELIADGAAPLDAQPPAQVQSNRAAANTV